MRLKDKVAIVTGGGSGFGEAIAKRFAEEGAKLIVNDINDEGGTRVAKEIDGAQGQGSAVYFRAGCAPMSRATVIWRNSSPRRASAMAISTSWSTMPASPM